MSTQTAMPACSSAAPGSFSPVEITTGAEPGIGAGGGVGGVFAIFSTDRRKKAAGEKSCGEKINEQTTNPLAGESVLSGGSSVISPGATGACQQAVGRVLPLKALAFHARLRERRADPANCGRCGNPSATRQCDDCRAYGAARRAKLRGEPVTVERATLDTLARRVASLEGAVARLQLAAAGAYKRGYRKGQALERKTRFRSDESIMIQEAATISHRYELAR